MSLMEFTSLILGNSLHYFGFLFSLLPLSFNGGCVVIQRHETYPLGKVEYGEGMG